MTLGLASFSRAVGVAALIVSEFGIVDTLAAIGGKKEAARGPGPAFAESGAESPVLTLVTVFLR